MGRMVAVIAIVLMTIAVGTAEASPTLPLPPPFAW